MEKKIEDNEAIHPPSQPRCVGSIESCPPTEVQKNVSDRGQYCTTCRCFWVVTDPSIPGVPYGNSPTTVSLQRLSLLLPLLCTCRTAERCQK